MLMQQTLTQLKSLKLDGMARAFEEQAALTASTSLSFEERFGMVVERELAWRDTRRLERLLKSAKLKNPQACIEDIEYRQSRGIDKSVVAALAGCDWIRNAQNLILTGPTGAGKTWIACAFGQQACRQGFSVMYVRVARLFEELKIAHGDGSFTRRLAQLAKMDVLLLDDWACRTSIRVPETICSKCSTIALARAPRSLPANCHWNTGTPGCRTRRSPTRSSTGSSIRPTSYR